MKLIQRELDKLEEELFREISYQDLGKETSRASYKKICKNKPYFVALVNPVSLKIEYFCESGLEFLGKPKLDFKASNFSFISSILSLDNAHIMSYGVQYFLKPGNHFLSLAYKVKRHDGEWRWVYSVSKLLKNQRSKTGLYTLTILYDIEDQFNTNHLSPVKEVIKLELGKEQLDKLASLSPREKELVALFKYDLKSSEMADKLFISPNTLQSHLKSIKKKLGVKSNVQLYKYACTLENRA